jgi:hypothetical protein
LPYIHTEVLQRYHKVRAKYATPPAGFIPAIFTQDQLRALLPISAVSTDDAGLKGTAIQFGAQAKPTTQNGLPVVRAAPRPGNDKIMDPHQITYQCQDIERARDYIQVIYHVYGKARHPEVPLFPFRLNYVAGCPEILWLAIRTLVALAHEKKLLRHSAVQAVLQHESRLLVPNPSPPDVDAAVERIEKLMKYIRDGLMKGMTEYK